MKGTIYLLAGMLVGVILMAKYQVSQRKPKKGLNVDKLRMLNESDRIQGYISQKQYEEVSRKLDEWPTGEEDESWRNV